MKRFIPFTLISLLILIFVPACTLTAEVTTPTPFNLDSIQTSVAATLAAQPSATDTPMPPPTEVATVPPMPTAKITYDDSLSAARIQFAPMTAWADINGTAGAQQSATYVLAASKGQIMSVSVLQGLGYLLTITGQDGAVLTPADSDKPFWRGALPATQDYFVKVSAPVDGDFTLRVAINPPGMADQVFHYENPQVGLSLAYTDSFAPINFPYRDQLRVTPALALNFIDSTFYGKTNLSEAYFVLDLLTDPSIVADCNQPSFPQEEAKGQETFGGITYNKSMGGGVGAGNYYEQTIYRTVQKNVCIEVVFFVHSTNIGNYAPGTVTEYDAAALIQKSENILKSLTLR